MSKIKLTGSNSGYVEIDSAADAGNLTLTLPTSGVRLLSNTDNVFSGITTTAELDINGKIDVSTDAVIARNLSVGGITTHTGTTILSDDVTFTGASYNVLWDKSDNQLEFGDNAKLSFGASSDMQLYHDGHNIINGRAGCNLEIQTNAFRVNNQADNKSMIVANDTDSVLLYFNNNEKIKTTNTGAVITGICTATSFSGDGSSLTGTGDHSNRNFIINGDMKIAQRGDGSTNFQSSGYYTADMWRCQAGNIGVDCQSEAINMSYAYAGAALHSENHRRALRISHSSAGTYNTNNEVYISQRIESLNVRNSYWDYDLGSGNAKITLSFWARSSVAQTYYCWIWAPDSGHTYAAAFTISNADTFQKFTITIPSYGALGFNNDSGVGLDVRWYLAMGTSYTDNSRALNTWQGYSGSAYFPDMTQTWITNSSANFVITGVQLEVGDTSSDYEKESYSQTLLKCKRYFNRHGWDTQLGVQKVRIIPGINEHPTNYGLYANFNFDVQMRAQPTVTFGSNVSVGRPQVSVSQKINSTSTGLNSPSGIGFMKWPSSGGTGGQLGSYGDAYYYVKIGNDANGYIDCSADL